MRGDSLFLAEAPAVVPDELSGELDVMGIRRLYVAAASLSSSGQVRSFPPPPNSIRRPVVLVLAAMKDKDLAAMTRALFPRAAAVVLTRVPYKRSASPEELLAAAPPSFSGPIFLEPGTRRAVELALSLGARTSATCPRTPRTPCPPMPVVIAGSLFLIGEVKRLRLF